jgi:hypothetical protein
VRIAPDAVSCDLDGEATIMNLQSGEYYGLDEVGGTVWQMISEPRKVSDIIEEITSRYDVAVDRCETDLLGLISKLADFGLVEIRNGQ